jgi:hypothetical protein
MNYDALTDTDIEALIATPKRVKNPSARWRDGRGSKQCNYNLEAGDFVFLLYLRQNTFDAEHFSCGLTLVKPDGQKLTLLRYNGSNHLHGDIKYACHIHKVSEKGMVAGKKPDRYAKETVKYHTLDGALFNLCQDANITGLANLKADEPDLFK